MDRPPELMSDAELVHALDQADADLARIETRRLRLIAAMDTSGYAERVGARDMVQYVEFRYRLDHSRAYRDVRLARALPKYASVTAALPDIDAAEGETSEVPVVLLRPAQAEAIVTALEKVPTTVPVADLDFAEQELVRLARHLAPADLRKAAEQSRDILDTDGPEPDEHKAAARETLTLKAADHGVKFTGYLANDNAELFRTLITTGARPHKTLDGEPDPRSREKRQADALTTTLTLAATALDAGTPSPTMPRPTSKPASSTETSTPETGSTEDDSAGTGSTASGSAEAGSLATDQQPVVVAGSGTGSSGDVGRDVVPGFGAKANLTVTIDFQDLKAATADAIGHTVYSNGLSAATIRRLACDAGVIPIVLGSNSEPLDVGRRERLVTKAIRRALNTRDRGCVVCNAPPVMCDAHHLISWIDGGETKVENLVLLCRRDHTDLHHGHWTITITNGKVHVTRPTWADPPPRHPHKPPTDPPRAHEPGDRPTPSEPSGGGPTPIGNPTSRSSTPADDPWGETATPADAVPGVRPSRWHADEQTRAEAARFAVWGERTMNGVGAGPPSFATI
ncbi:HNH endonuclease [Kribbella sindirgiensis]|uniref:HNH endonuclease n=1 Tax=Kribbella sindirgiensis TaxID=1124744 RepID=A0A4R0IBQ7_9ACTN|nr:HNH endonuclease signature motif containing protein [Kribbella sindirgiensis]TCC29817.1 HNH endonuclease [Kribbella sindirgiensis]